ncbi:hypothetical protein LRY65_02260 [Candidatus Woesebacteria bacterium]|nr:hypothetical protein [Candidatus Woesebacteria bacterium]MCD8507298.1 hypothetical protein [Candidatus Woesebacteria bacterium]MCD8527016.1 hypothetical protein [Candidatus Woesebacteria bacterium]MCD8546747.1 hypothetical protein [Candidatus Woesebacteria bacterium]
MSTPSTKSPKKIIGICGTTANTVRCAESLHQNGNFEIAWVVTPPPRPVGRHQDITPSELETWAHKHSIPVIHVEKSLREVRDQLESRQAELPIDFLLVVDFGYLIPQWLLDLPNQAAVNIHPSELPKYRGSSPGQYVLLLGETESAVTIMRMDAGLDTGPIIRQIPFAVDPRATQATYYDVGFHIAEETLPATLLTYQRDQEQPQPTQSPTPTADRFSKQDGFIPFEMLAAAQTDPHATILENWRSQLGSALQTVLENQSLSASTLIDRAVRAFDPWPSVWTLEPEYRGRQNVRRKILGVEIDPNSELLRITRWQYDGEKVKQIQ